MQHITEFLSISFYHIKLFFYLALILSSSIGIGAFFTKKINDISVYEKYGFSAGVGLIIITFIAFFLCVFKIFYPIVIIGLILILFLISFRSSLSLQRELIQAIKLTKKSLSSYSYLYISLILIIMVLPLLNALMPPVSWDAMVYHLTIPKFYLQNHGFKIMPFNFFSNLPMNIDILFLIGMTFGDDRLPALIHFSFGVLLLIILFGFMQRKYSAKSGLLSITLLLSTPIFLKIWGYPYIDIGISFFFFLLFISIFQWIEKFEKKWLVCISVFIAYILGAKFNTLIYILGFMFFIFIKLIYERKISVSKIIKSYFVIFIITFILFMPWMIKSYLYTGNPLYPIFYKYLGGSYLNENISEQLDCWLGNFGDGKSLNKYIFAVWNVFFLDKIISGNFGGRLSPSILIFAIISLIVNIKNKRNWLYFSIFIIIFYIWFSWSQQMRFLLPALPILSIVGGSLLTNLKIRFGKKAFHFELYSFIVILIFVLFSFIFLLPEFESVISFDFLTGKEKKEIYVRKHLVLYGCFEEIERITNKDEVIAAIFESRGYYLNRQYYSDVAIEASYFLDSALKLKTPEKIKSFFKNINIRYILIYNAQKDLWKDAMQKDIIFHNRIFSDRVLNGIINLENFLKEECDIIYTVDKVVLYKIKE